MQPDAASIANAVKIVGGRPKPLVCMCAIVHVRAASGREEDIEVGADNIVLHTDEWVGESIVELSADGKRIPDQDGIVFSEENFFVKTAETQLIIADAVTVALLGKKTSDKPGNFLRRRVIDLQWKSVEAHARRLVRYSGNLEVFHREFKALARHLWEITAMSANEKPKPKPGLLVEDSTVVGGVDKKTGAPVIKAKTTGGKADESVEPTDKNEK